MKNLILLLVIVLISCTENITEVHDISTHQEWINMVQSGEHPIKVAEFTKKQDPQTFYIDRKKQIGTRCNIKDIEYAYYWFAVDDNQFTTKAYFIQHTDTTHIYTKILGKKNDKN